MSLDFKDLQVQVRQMGDDAVDKMDELRVSRETVFNLLAEHAQDMDALREKVDQAARKKPNLRCAGPGKEALDQAFSLPPTLDKGVLIAADGSQIPPSRHLQVNYALVNVGAITMHTGSTSVNHPSVNMGTPLPQTAGGNCSRSKSVKQGQWISQFFLQKSVSGFRMRGNRDQCFL